MPKISICIPAYNARAFLGETLKSIAAQSFSDWELIVVEDGSTEDSADIVEHFSEKVAQPVHYIRHEKNRGLTNTRNTGIEAANADWIAILDADDLWSVDHLKTCWACAQKTGSGIIHGGSVLFQSETGEALSTRAPDKTAIQTLPLSLFEQNYIIQPSSVLLEKALWSKAGGFDPSFSHVEDREMWLRCLRAGGEIHYTGEQTCRYRKHASAMSAQSLPMAEANLRVFEMHQDWEAIPESIRKNSLNSALLSVGRLARSSKPARAAECFKRLLSRSWSLKVWLLYLISKWRAR